LILPVCFWGCGFLAAYLGGRKVSNKYNFLGRLCGPSPSLLSALAFSIAQTLDFLNHCDPRTAAQHGPAAQPVPNQPPYVRSPIQKINATQTHPAFMREQSRNKKRKRYATLQEETGQTKQTIYPFDQTYPPPTPPCIPAP